MHFTIPLFSNDVLRLAAELILLLREYNADIVVKVMINIASVERSCSGQEFSDRLAYFGSQSEPVNLLIFGW